ncbi:hypothetical protein NDU88_004536 [Pleurodeles waltl]|uniref:Uncharacterized protein n=1 Tax=Pleurodeles waltl TaxID=8319 RepID=A0AAV7W6X7_PLEWA|nr:hypothetical protein NDU88_004536 [Pleurodeles waltl]
MGIPSSNSTDFSIDVSNVPSERVVTSTPSENTKIIPPDMSDTDINSGRMRDKEKLRFVFVFVYFSFARAPSASAEHSKFEESSSRQLPTDSRLGCFFARAPSASAEHSKFEESSSRQLPTDSRLGCLSGVFLEHFGRRAIFIEDPPTPTFVLYGQEVEARMSPTRASFGYKLLGAYYRLTVLASVLLSEFPRAVLHSRFGALI